MNRILFVFLDGVGLGPADPGRNPLAAATLPTFAALLDGRPPLLEHAPFHGRHASLVGVDANLGVAGLPQSGTGQAALLTGLNAPALYGRHFGPWVPTSLRETVRSSSFLARAARAGRAVAFANAYPRSVAEGHTGRDEAGTHSANTRPARAPIAFLALRAGPPLAALGAGVLTRHADALARGDAVASEIINDGWRDRLGYTHLPDIPAAAAGRNLARIAAAHDLTLFAHYSTDAAGHRRDLHAGVAAIERVDAFLGGLLDALPPRTCLIITSDHGNLEDCSAGHTRNPALGLVAGPGHAEIARRMRALTDISGVVEENG